MDPIIIVLVKTSAQRRLPKLQLRQQGNVGQKFRLVDFETSESKSSYLNASNLDENDYEELIEASG